MAEENIYVFCGWLECFDSKFRILVNELRCLHVGSKVITVVNFDGNHKSDVFDKVVYIKNIPSLYFFLLNNRKSFIYVLHRKSLSRLELNIYFLSLFSRFPLIKWYPLGFRKFNQKIEDGFFRRVVLKSLLRKISINTKIIAVYLFFLPFLVLKKRKEPEEIKKILFIRLDRFGDMVLTFPSLVALRKHYPEADISVLCSKGGHAFLESQNKGTEPKLLNKIIIWDDVWDMHGGFLLKIKHFVAFIKKGNQLHGNNYDCIIQPVSLGVWTLLALLLNGDKTAIRVSENSFLPKLLLRFINSPILVDERTSDVHVIRQNFECLSVLGNHDLEKPYLVCNEAIISEDITSLNFCHKIVINLSAGDQVRQLPFETTLQLIKKILSRYKKYRVLLVGTESDNKFAERLCHSIPTNVLNFVGKTSIDDLIYIFKNAPVLVTSDTGTMHLAAMTDIHVVAYFTAGSLRHFAPVTDNCTIIQHELGCSGCGDMCYTEEMPKPCMAAITADELYDAVSAALEGKREAEK